MTTSTVPPSPLAYRVPMHTSGPQETALALPQAAERDRWVARPSLSCVVPCHNEARNLDQLLPRLIAALEPLIGHWEIILVDDGSTDDTSATFARWLKHGAVRTIELSRNFGKEAALSAGLQAARGDLVVMLDADLQHEPGLIPSCCRSGAKAPTPFMRCGAIAPMKALSNAWARAASTPWSTRPTASRCRRMPATSG